MILKVVLDVNAGDSPQVAALTQKRDLESLYCNINTFPPLIAYYFSMFVKVSLTPGSLSLMPTSKWMQKYFSGDARNSM
jgi:hypothetical protein